MNDLFFDETDFDIRDKFKKEIEERGIKKSWIAEQLFVSRQTITNILNKNVNLTESLRASLNKLLKTEF